MNAQHDGRINSAPPVLIHLTENINTLAAIVGHGVLRAMTPYGGAFNHQELRDSQRVVSLSEINLSEAALLAERHGPFGLGFHRRWVQSRGAAPVWYLPRESPIQQRVFEIVKSLAFRSHPVLNHFLWELTPFIDYPRDGGPAGSPYDWRWEREWRVRGDLAFVPTDVVVLFAPEDTHDVLREMWLWEALDADQGLMPPAVDTNWPVAQQLGVIRRGTKRIASELDGFGSPQMDARIPQRMADFGEVPIDTAATPLEWVEDDELARAEHRAEWSAWLDEMGRDDC